MPRADDFCAFELGSHPVPTKTNPLGVKGAGECGTVGALAAVMNAINDALAPLGVRNLLMPATPERVWRAIRAGARATLTVIPGAVRRRPGGRPCDMWLS